MKRSLLFVVLVTLVASPCFAQSRNQDARKKHVPPRSLMEAGVRLPHLVTDESNLSAPLGLTGIATSKGFSVTSYGADSACYLPATYSSIPSVTNVVTTTVKTGDAQDRIKVSFSGMAQIGDGVADGLYSLCSYTVFGDNTVYGCPGVNGWGLVLTSTSAVGSANAAAWTTVLATGIAPNKEVTISIDITKLAAATDASLCGPSVVIER